MALEHWLRLSLTAGLGPVLIGRLVELCGSAQAAAEASMADLQGVEGIGSARARGIHASLASAGSRAEAEIRRASDLGMRILCREDGEYPELLKSVSDPPPVLYIRGALEPRDLQGLAIVGSRRCTHYGREQADRLAALLAGAGFTVLSGGARGIDSAAHRGAMKHPMGRTIAVLGSGVDVPYPPENEPLFRQIAARGAVLSELPLGTPPNAENFPRRNRIVSGMSRGVLVIEADERSGALITARLANEDQGRPVFALPGRVDNPMARGPHQLIRDGAVLVTGIEDILEGLGPLPASAHEPLLFPEELVVSEPRAAKTTAEAMSVGGRQRAILEEMGGEPATVDDLIERTGLAASAILQELTFLSLRGLVQRVDGQTYRRRG